MNSVVYGGPTAVPSPPSIAAVNTVVSPGPRLYQGMVDPPLLLIESHQNTGATLMRSETFSRNIVYIRDNSCENNNWCVFLNGGT